MLVLAPSPSLPPCLTPSSFSFFPRHVCRVGGAFLLPSLSYASLPAASRALNHRSLPPSTPLEHITEMRWGVSLFIKPSLSNTHSEKPSGEYTVLVSCSSELIIVTQGLFQSF